MADIRRPQVIVTTVNAEGESVFEPGIEPDYAYDPQQPWLEFALAWGVDSVEESWRAERTVDPFFPPRGGVRCSVLRWGARNSALDRVMPDVVDPRLAQLDEVHPHDRSVDGFHATATTDLLIVLEGEITLELENGDVRRVRAGDIVVQRGTSHNWRNDSDAEAVVACVMLGTPG